VNIYSNVVHESSSSFLAPAYAEQLLSSYLTPLDAGKRHSDDSAGLI
jgi:hypothetical protein